MNIVMVTNTYLPRVSGVTRSIHTFTQEYIRQGHKVLIIAPHNDTSLPQQEPGIIRLPALAFKNNLAAPLPSFHTASHALHDFSPDIIHSHHPFILGNTALRLAASWNIPLFFTHHSLYDQWTDTTPAKSDALRTFVQNLTAGYANLCRCVFVPTTPMVDLLRQRGVHTRIEVVPTGIYTTDFSRTLPRPARNYFNLPPDAPVVGYVGRLSPEKNINFLGQALSLFLKQHPLSYALIVGTGPSRKKLLNHFADQGVAEQVVFSGLLQGTHLAAAYQAMDITVSACIHETQGLTFIESFAAGTPVVALEAPGAIETIVPEKNGWLVKEHTPDALAAILKHAISIPVTTKADMRIFAQKTAAHYDAHVCADRALTLYHSLQKPSLSSSDVVSRWQRRLKIESHLWSQRLQAFYTFLSTPLY